MYAYLVEDNGDASPGSKHFSRRIDEAKGRPPASCFSSVATNCTEETRDREAEVRRQSCSAIDGSIDRPSSGKKMFGIIRPRVSKRTASSVRRDTVGRRDRSDERGTYDSVYFESNKYLQSLCGACYGWRDIGGSGEQSCNERTGNSRLRIIQFTSGASFRRGSDVESFFAIAGKSKNKNARRTGRAFRTNLRCDAATLS